MLIFRGLGVDICLFDEIYDRSRGVNARFARYMIVRAALMMLVFKVDTLW